MQGPSKWVHMPSTAEPLKGQKVQPKKKTFGAELSQWSSSTPPLLVWILGASGMGVFPALKWPSAVRIATSRSECSKGRAVACLQALLPGVLSVSLWVQCSFGSHLATATEE